jgi:L-iditol 2-dehydrogenase
MKGTTTMKALLLTEYSHFELVDLPRPVPGADEVLIEVAACGICGSDVHGYDGASGRRIPPVVMGHEAAGTIVSIGSDVSGFQAADRVTFDSTVYCGHCHFCLAGQVNLCDDRQVIGVFCGEYRRSGAFAEYLVVPERILYRLPADFEFAEAAMLEAVAVALHAIAISPVSAGQAVLVIGAGMIGLLLLQGARAAGAAQVYVSDIDESRLQLARELRASETLCLSGDELTTRVQQLTGGRGVDVVLEAVGRSETIAAGLDCIRKGGTVTLVGNISPSVSMPL